MNRAHLVATLVGTLAHRRAAFGFLGMDPPDHGRLRRLVQPAFGPARVQGYRDRIERIADDLLDAAPRGRTFDLVSGFAAAPPPAERMPALRVACRVERRRSAMIRGFTRFPVAG